MDNISKYILKGGVKMLKDQFYNNFTYSCYKYAPESFLLFYQGKKVKLDRYAAADFGDCLICKGKQELLKLLKRWIRSKSNLSQKINNKKTKYFVFVIIILQKKKRRK